MLMTTAIDENFASRMLGVAVLRVWGDLPHDVQELLFEQALRGNEDNRAGLALLLHRVHPKTVIRTHLSD